MTEFMFDVVNSIHLEDSMDEIEESPFRNQLSEFVYQRTYARWLEDKGRRETWSETVDRYIQFLKEERNLPSDLVEECRNAIYNLDVLPSMRALWSAGETARRDNTTLYNCSTIVLDSLKSFSEMLYVLMGGVGAGFSVESQFTSNLPVVGVITGEKVSFVIDDSSSGWADALYFGLTHWYKGVQVDFDYSQIRPRGAVLKTKGGRASGPEPLKRLLDFAQETIFNASGRQLTTLECHDIACFIGEIVMVGGVRRSALISFSDPEDEAMRHAKDWSRGQFPVCRYMANNSAVYTERPAPEVFWSEWNALVRSGSGERGFYMVTEPKTKKRGGQFRSNPCVTGDTRVMTRNGLVQIRDLVGKPTDLILDSRLGVEQGSTTDAGAFVTGVKPVFRLDTKEGFSLKLTEDHRVMTTRGWVPASDLVPGDSIHVLDHRGGFGNVGTYDSGYQMGASIAGNVPSAIWASSKACQRGFLSAVEGLDSLSPNVIGDIQMLYLNQGVFTVQQQGRLVRVANPSYTATFTSLTPVGVETVYDLTQPDTHSFIANGLVVHNCGEILLRFALSQDPVTGEGGGGQFCNLTAAVMRPYDTRETMARKIRLATWLGAIQSSFTHFPYLRPAWAKHCEEDRLLGVDITGQCDNPRLSQDPEVLSYLNQVARDTAASACAYLGINYPAAITCGKPSGNSSQMVDCSSGFHPRYAPYYFRHVRTDGKDPLTQLLRDSGVPLFKENGMDHLPDEEVPVWVARFPVKAPEGAMTRNTETAIQMLERYRLIMNTWCGEKGHNQSATIYVREDEWNEVGQWVWDHFDEITGLSFLPYDGGVYNLAPYQEITQAEYEQAMLDMPVIDYSLLSSYEQEDRGRGATELACVGGACEV